MIQLVKLYAPDHTWREVEVTDNSTHYQAIGGEDLITLEFLYDEYFEVPIGSYVVVKGVQYTSVQTSTFIQNGSRHFKITVLLYAPYATSQHYMFRDPSGKIQFSLYLTPIDYAEYLCQEMNRRPTERGWTVGTAIDSPAKAIAFNAVTIYEAANLIAEAFSTEVHWVDKRIHFAKLQHNLEDPLVLGYGKGKGIKPGTSRAHSDDSAPFEILYVQGSDRNIDPHTYGNDTLLLPKGQELTYEDKTYIVSADGTYLFEKTAPLQTYQDAYIDLTNYYPSREGTVSAVEVINAETNLYDILDNSIPEALDYKNYLIVGETATIIFQTGLLAGKEFDVDYDHTDRRFLIVPAEIEGQIMPNINLLPKVGDTYRIFNQTLPQEYIQDNTEQAGASWDMFREAARYMYENKDPRYTYSGEVWPPWAYANWDTVGLKFILAGTVKLVSQQYLPLEGVSLRIISITTPINNPYAPKISLSNTPIKASFTTRQNELEGEEVHLKDSENYLKSLNRRSWRDAKETAELLVNAALAGFTEGISPLTVQTMQLLVGDASLQFVFVDDKETPAQIGHLEYYDASIKTFIAEAGIIQHKTLGITSLTDNHAPSDYKYWDVPLYEVSGLEPTQAYYLYTKASKSEETANFLLSPTPQEFDTDPDYYWLLTGILNTEQDGQRSYAPMYGFSLIEPGRMVIDRIQSSNFNLELFTGVLIDLLNHKIVMGGDAELILRKLTIMSPNGEVSKDLADTLDELEKSSKGISTITNYYLIYETSTGVTTGTPGWSETPTLPTEGKPYLWNYASILYTDGTSSQSPPAVISTHAENGADGADGIGISQIVEYYAVNNSTTPPADAAFSTSVQNPTATNRYLWNYEVIQYTNGSEQTTDKRIIGVYGEKGDNGQPALPTVYRISATQPDTPTSSSVPPPNWSLTPPSASEVMSNPAPIDNPMLLSAPLGVTVSPAVVNKNSGDAWTGDEVEISMILSNGQKQILTYSDGRDWTGNNQWTWYSPSSYSKITSRTYTLQCQTSEGTESFQGQLSVLISGGEKVLSYIDVTSLPNKTTYNVGEVLDTNGMIVRAYYTDGTSANLSNSQVSESYNFSTAGTKTVTVSYGGKSDTFSVTVVESSVTLSSIDIANPPTKTIYYVGDVINTSGMVVDAVYSNGSRSTIPNNQVQTSYNFNTTGTKTVTVSYSGKSDTFSVSVVARPAATLSRIDVITGPQKTSYKINEYIDTNGLYVLGTYSDGTTADVTAQCTYSPQVFTTTGLKTVTVSFSGKTDTFTVDIYTEESSSGTQIWACTALGWNASGGVTGWSEPTRWNGEDGARNAYTLFSFAYGLSATIAPVNWSYEVPAYVEGQHLWQRVQQYIPNDTNTGWILESTTYSVLREYIDDKIEDAKNEAISTLFDDVITPEEIEKLKNGGAPFVFDTDKQIAYLRKVLVEALAADEILTAMLIATNIKTAASGERVEITQASRGLTAFDEDGNIALKVHGKEFSTFSTAPSEVAVVQKSTSVTASTGGDRESIGESQTAIATISIDNDVNEVTFPAATIDLQALVELGEIVEGIGNAALTLRLMLDSTELGVLSVFSDNGTQTKSVTIPSIKTSLGVGAHNLYFIARWDCQVLEGAEVAQVIGSVRWETGTIQIDYKDDLLEVSKEGIRLSSGPTQYIEWKRLPGGNIRETRVGVEFDAVYGVLASGMVSASGVLSKQFGKVTSSSNTGTGTYRINHTIGHTDYVPQITFYGEAGFADITTIASTYFIIRTRKTDLTADDKAFVFTCNGGN